MEDRVKLTVLGLSYNQLQSGAFALLLAQVDGPYRIPVVIGAAEAQSIAIRLESITTPRPLTHDLFMSFAQAFGIRLREVFIYKFEDGIFSSELTFTDGERQIVSRCPHIRCHSHSHEMQGSYMDHTRHIGRNRIHN